MPSPGWKFNPSDEELLTFYLKRKTLGLDTQPIVIGEVNFCQFEPCDFPDLCKLKSNSVWHFFCPPEFKYPGRGMRNRQTRAGFWKPTGEPKRVNAKFTNQAIGWRRTLAFYQGTFKKNEKTKWQAYEYELLPDPISNVKGHLVLCKVERRDKETSKRQPRKLQKTSKGRVSERVASSPSSFESISSNSITNSPTQMMSESPCIESEVTDPATCVSENQVTSELSANPGKVLVSDSKKLHLEQMVVCSVRRDAEPTRQMDSDFGNQNQDDENANMSVSNEGACIFLMGRPLSSCDKGEAGSIIMASDLGNHKRDSNININIYGFFDKTSNELASGFGDLNNGNHSDILAFIEGQCSSFILGFEGKDPMTELLSSEESSWSYLLDCPLEDDEVENSSREIIPEPVAEQVAELDSLVAETPKPTHAQQKISPLQSFSKTIAFCVPISAATFVRYHLSSSLNLPKQSLLASESSSRIIPDSQRSPFDAPNNFKFPSIFNRLVSSWDSSNFWLLEQNICQDL